MLEPVVLISHLNEICMLSIGRIRHTKRLSAKLSLSLIRIKTAKNNLQRLAKDDICTTIGSSIVLLESPNVI